MKKVISAMLLASLLFSALSLFSCDRRKKGETDTVLYRAQDLVSSGFGGIGMEWGVYEDKNKLAPNAWERITAAADRLRPGIVRCMTNFDWIVTDFDTKGTPEVEDDTWSYRFDNKHMDSACEILDYCQAHDVDVAFGVWNVLGRADNSDNIGMIFNATSDIRWAKMAADLLEYLVRYKGYTCIKWFVNSNEPNYTGIEGQSKNAYNTYEKWEKGVLQVRAALDAVGLQSVDIVGGDVTFTTDGSATTYLDNLSRNAGGAVNNYGVHLYISDLSIINGSLQTRIAENYQIIRHNDPALGKTKHLYIWEAGLLDGKNAVTDCNSYIGNFSYGLRMADYTVQSILAGVNGVAYWDFDDAMHFMYTESGMTAKEWGMFSTLNDATALRQEYRPWYHSSVLLSNLLQKGSRVYGSHGGENEKFRTLAVVSPDGQDAGFVAVNRDSVPVTRTFRLEEKIESDRLYVYLYSEKTLRLDENGFVTYNYTASGSLCEGIRMEIPAGSVVIVSTRPL